MGPSRESLEETFRELSDEELLRRCISGELTDLAQSIGLAEVRARGLELPAAAKPVKEEEPPFLGDWVTVARYLSYAEVHVLRSCLEAAGIPAVVADAQLVQTDALLSPAMRGASLRVPAACSAEAGEVIAAFRRGDFQLDESFKPDPMQRMRFYAVVLASLFASVAGAQSPTPLQSALPGTSKVVVVAEGELEPRSVGSYSLRVYGGANPGHPYDDFIAGLVWRRDGSVEKLVFGDVDGDRNPDIVIVIRSAGTGGYLSADAFRLRGRGLWHLASVKGLANDADPLRALKQKRAKASPPTLPGRGP